jgi:SAM-dependent methyltransferase
VGLPQDDVGRIDREISFHDRRFRGGLDARGTLSGIYRLTQRSKEHYLHLVTSYAADHDVVELGVGLESILPAVAWHCASFRGLDISSEAISQAVAEFSEFLVPGKRGFMEGNAEHTELCAASADLVCGTGIVHHLDLGRLLGELQRLLRPSGRAVFFEPLGYNPLINAFRALTPGMRTEDEHPLQETDLADFRRAFRVVQTRYFHLLSLSLIPVCGLSLFSSLYPRIEKLDDSLFRRFPWLQRYAWVVVIDCSEPIAN